MRTPVSTYRLQITARFDLFAAAEVLPYLHDLGVDWVYLSPLLEAEPGSDHGYDVVAHDRIDPARGGADGLAAVSAEARRLGMGVLVDIVPNHVGIATPHVNTGWWDLLTHGPSSRQAAAFDVDWDLGGGRVRIPVVGDDDTSAIEVDVAEGVVRYHDHEFPLAPGTLFPGQSGQPQCCCYIPFPTDGEPPHVEADVAHHLNERLVLLAGNDHLVARLHEMLAEAGGRALCRRPVLWQGRSLSAHPRRRQRRARPGSSS